MSGDTGDTEACTYDATTARAFVSGWELLPRNDYASVMDHLANVGPLSVAVDSSNWGAYSVSW